MLKFACIAPHPPIILPSVGSQEDRAKVKKTIDSLEDLGKKLRETNPSSIIISSPHPDWGFNVPLFFLAKNFKGKIKTYLTGTEEPEFHFNKGKELYWSKVKGQKSKVAVIASGDLSHRLKEDGPYGLHPEGPRFDKELVESLKNKDIENILNLNDKYPEAGECGLRSFCFLLGVLEAWKKEMNKDYKTGVLSYEAPFGVGYLVADFKL